ncbi:hybrid sensor histidine kinase/response regulator [Luteimonas vadosa]|uniref:histidine kinase n=1 Tax=Luteimonas vadosa TaxID=1165507 RepID=A0ABP9DUU8_9GAMM
MGRGWIVVAALVAHGVAKPAVPELPQPRQISVFDGLPSNRINALAEDRQGYLWVATRDGLARYDGVGFRIWRVGDGLRDNFIWTVHVDAKDRVWLGTQQAGLVMLDVSRSRFVHFDRDSHPAIGSNDVWSIATTPDGMLWFGTADGGLHQLSPGGTIRRFMPRAGDPRSLPSPGVSRLAVDRDGSLWVGTKGGVARWTGRDFERLALGEANAFVNHLDFDRAGALWIGLQSGGFVRRRNGRIERMPWIDPVQGAPALHMLLEDRQGAHWLDTASGLSRERNGEVQDVPLYSNTSRGMVRPAWSAAYEDREGGLWFASLDSGLWRLPANWRNFSVLQRRVGDDSSPANAFVHGIAPAAGNGLWLVGSGGVLDWMDPDTGAIEHRLSQACGSFVNFGVQEGADGGVWIGCFGQLVRFDPASGGVRRWYIDDDADAALPGEISHFVEDPDGGLWIASDRGVQQRDADGGVVRTVLGGDGGGLPDNARIEQLARAPDGGLWVVGDQGMHAWNAGARRFEPVAGAPSAHVHGFAIAPDGSVWLARRGLLAAYHWDGAGLSLERTVDARQGLPAVAPGGVAVDAQGVVWLTTVRGLLRYDPDDDRLRTYGVRDGLPSQEFNPRPIRISPRGYLAAGTADGLLLFHPQQVRWSDRTPTLAIESIDLRRGDARIELPRSDAIALRHDDRDLRVVARLLSFTDAHAHRYRFRLAGYDPDWVNVGASGERVFSRLEPGSYRLGVQARTADDEWSPVQTLDFEVLPPWWRTAWALLAFLLAGLVAVLWLAHAYRKRLRRRHEWHLAEQKRELAEQASLAKTRFLATLGHEVRTPMTGVLGMSELLLATGLDGKQREYIKSIRMAGEHLMRLVNDALDLSRIEAGKLELDPQPFDLHALVEGVVALSAPMARGKGLEFHDDIAHGVPRWVRGDALRVRQILLNLVGNACKFTERGTVSLTLSCIADGVRFVVADTGPGLNEEQKQRLFHRFEQAEGARTAARYGGSGLGLAISQELAAAMGGRIGIESTPGRGTDFIVVLPLHAEDAVHVDPPISPARASRALDVLIVEDDLTVAEVITSLLQAQGHRVTHAAHGLAALSEVAAKDFDIALLDLDLPGLDGLALARQLRAQGFDPPLVAVTARADADAEPQAREAGFDRFLRKPLTGAMLAEVLAGLPCTTTVGRRT